MGKDTFKQFVRNNPNLADYVHYGDMTWQKFYEMYELYGDKSVVWDPYQLPLKKKEEAVVSKSSSRGSFKDVVQMVKGMDMATVQKGIDGMQKAIGLLQEFTTKTPTAASTYEPRPLYRYFED